MSRNVPIVSASAFVLVKAVMLPAQERSRFAYVFGE